MSYRDDSLVKVFISYSQEDLVLRKELEKHLAILQHQQVIKSWHDGMIMPGEESVHQIQINISESDIILLLVSSSYLHAQKVWEFEVVKALEKHKKGESVVIPVLLRDCFWEIAPFSKLATLPSNGKPISSSYWTNIDEALTEITKGIYDSASFLRKQSVKKVIDNQTNSKEEKNDDVNGKEEKNGSYKLCQELSNKKSDYIFTFGNIGSGKSTLIAALNQHLLSNLQVDYPTGDGSLSGKKLLFSMIHDLKAGRFPNRTIPGVVEEIDLEITNGSNKNRFTFLEISGEDLRDIDIEYYGKFSNEINSYLLCEKINISFLITIDYEKVISFQEDMIVYQFLKYISRVRKYPPKIGIVLTKFDRGLSENSLDKIFQTYLPNTYNILFLSDSMNIKVFPFSVGKVNMENNYNGDALIENLELGDCSVITNWMINDKKESKLGFIKRWFK